MELPRQGVIRAPLTVFRFPAVFVTHANGLRLWAEAVVLFHRMSGLSLFSRFGGDLLSHVLRRSTIGATALNGRVRDGIGCFARAMTTKPGKKRAVPFRVRAGLRAPFWGKPHQYLIVFGRSAIVPVLCACSSCCERAFVFAIDGPGSCRMGDAPILVMLLLDQIKPIEQLVPVS